MVHNEVGHILLLDILWIHPLSQIVQIMCVMCDIYEYISAKEDFFFLGCSNMLHLH